jgi:Sucrase/ferredoxin-like
LLLVCGHGSRDRCGALYGTPVFTTLAERLAPEEVWISSHQGGHRFAANLLALPAACSSGESLRTTRVSSRRALAGHIELDRYRGGTCYEGAVQAAELAVRGAARLEGVADVSVAEVAGSEVTLRTWDGAQWTVAIEELDGPSVPASCGAEPVPQRHFRAAYVTQRLSRYASSVIHSSRPSSASGARPIGSKVPKTTRTQLPAANAPWAEIVPDHDLSGSSTSGNGGAYRSAARIAGKVPSAFRCVNSSCFLVANSISPNERLAVSVSKATLESFRTQTLARQPSGST